MILKISNDNLIQNIFSLINKGDYSDITDAYELLIKDIMEINQKLWYLEDIARMKELGFERVALTKGQIDLTNQIRHDLIREMDYLLDKKLDNTQKNDLSYFHSETPGMLIDRISILLIKKTKIEELLLMVDDNSKIDLSYKFGILSKQIDQLCNFLDLYLKKVESKEWFFVPQESMKIYNNEKIRKYIKKQKNPYL